jgi:hypothetical protein
LFFYSLTTQIKQIPGGSSTAALLTHLTAFSQDGLLPPSKITSQGFVLKLIALKIIS